MPKVPQLRSNLSKTSTAVAVMPGPGLRPLAQRITALHSLLALVGPAPSQWVTAQARPLKTEGEVVVKSKSIATIPCETYKKCVNAWRKAMKWTDGLDSALVAMLAAVVSTKAVGDQYWIKIIGPASCGKTTIAEGIAVAQQYVRSVDAFRGFTSGYVLPDGTTPDLASQLDGMTLITMDGDTLIQSPNLANILSDARRLYDGSLNSTFKNAADKDVKGHRMTWILCGTNSLRSIDSSELGERFIDCVVMDGIDDELEDEVLTRIAYRVNENMAVESNGSPENRYAPEIVEAMQYTGGYVEYLRQNAQPLFSKIKMSPEALHRCTRLGKFVAHMRARPSRVHNEKGEREFAGRLVSVLTRNAICTAVVMNRPSVDQDVLKRVNKIALDTSRGQPMMIVEKLLEPRFSTLGLEPAQLAGILHIMPESINKLIRFMVQIKMLELNHNAGANGAKTNHKRYVVTERMKKLYYEALGIKK